MAQELLDEVGLGGRARSQPGELSQGEQQRVAVCWALINRPAVLLAGVRYIDVDVDATLTLPGPAMRTFNITTGPSETDVMLGARLIGRFADRWHWGLRGDLSFGGTEGTYNGLASVGYTFGQSRLFTLTAGYRYMSIDIGGMNQRGAPTEAEVTMSGPILGFIFNF